MCLLYIHNKISKLKYEPKYFVSFYQPPHIRKKGYGILDQFKAFIGFLISGILILVYGIPIFWKIDDYYLNIG